MYFQFGPYTSRKWLFQSLTNKNEWIKMITFEKYKNWKERFENIETKIN